MGYGFCVACEWEGTDVMYDRISPSSSTIPHNLLLFFFRLYENRLPLVRVFTLFSFEWLLLFFFFTRYYNVIYTVSHSKLSWQIVIECMHSVELSTELSATGCSPRQYYMNRNWILLLNAVTVHNLLFTSNVTGLWILTSVWYEMKRHINGSELYDAINCRR